MLFISLNIELTKLNGPRFGCVNSLFILFFARHISHVLVIMQVRVSTSGALKPGVGITRRPSRCC